MQAPPCMISVLCVDDEPAILDIEKEFLEKEGEVHVETVSSASMAIDAFQHHFYDAVVADYLMPEMNGIQLLQQLRLQSGVPFILFTGKGREEIAVQAINNGADFYVQKGGNPVAEFYEITNKIKQAVQRRRTEQLLKESEQKFRTFADFTYDWEYWESSDNRYIYMSPSCKRVTGYTPEEFFDDPGLINRIVLADDRHWWETHQSEAEISMDMSSVEFRILTKSGDIRWISHRCQPVFDINGNSLGRRTGNTDITNRKNTEMVLVENEERYRSLFEGAAEGIVIADLKTKNILHVNPALCTMLGFSENELRSLRFKDIHPKESRDVIMGEFDALARGDKISLFSIPCLRKDSSVFYADFGASRLLIDGRPCIVGYFTDITEKKRAEDALKLSEIRYRRLFESAKDGILILDFETGSIMDANPFLLDLIGYPLDFILDKKICDIGFITDKSLYEQSFAQLKKEKYIRFENLPFATKDDRSISVEFVSNVYTVDHQKVIQCNIRDITERRKAEEALILANKKLNLLSSITRHDILNQLTALYGYIELSNMVVKDAMMKRFIEPEKNITHTIRRIISFTKDYQDVGIKRPQWQNLHSLIFVLAKTVELQSVNLIIELDQLEVYADPLLETVVYNLLENAIRHGRPLTYIRFSYHLVDNGCLILCEDDGVGISARDKDTIFKRGFGKHTGFGLFLSKEILGITGFSLKETGTPGKGARFEIFVPEGAFRIVGKMPMPVK
jgi:PAS domain S-box-containing protein